MASAARKCCRCASGGSRCAALCGASGESDSDGSFLATDSSSPEHGADLTPFYLAEFDLDPSAAELAPAPEEGHEALLQAFEDQHCLIKTVTNEEWVNLIRKLQGKRFRTSTSLPPPGGRGIRFFGKVPGFSLGLIWDRRKLDLTEAFIWPSGYFAKSEFNVDADGTLLNGRKEALVTLEEVIRTNEALSYWHTGRGCMVTGEVLPYNEIMTYVQGTLGLVALFARSTSVMHLLWAMGVRALLLRTLPAAGELPILVHDPEQGMRPFGRSAQRQLVSQFLERVRRPLGNVGLPCLPIDANTLGLSKRQQLELHASYGLTDEALTALVTSLLAGEGSDDHGAHGDSNGDDTDAVCVAVHRVGEPRAQTTGICADKARSILAFGLSAAVHAHNSASAVSLIRHLAPTLLVSTGGQTSEPVFDLQTCDGVALRPGLSDGNDFVACLHALAREAHSPNTLAPVGAMLAIDDFASGRMLPRIMDSCSKLESWLQQANSFMFRIQSWRELNGHHLNGDAPALSSFVSHKAVENRTHFYDDLMELEHLEESHDLLHGMQKLHSLIGQLHHPCMRLEMLRHILGLDERFDLQTINAVVNLAYSVISDAVKLGVATPKGNPSVLPTNTGYAPLFQLEAAACRLQGINLENPSAAGVAAPTF